MESEELESEESYYSMSMPEALDIDAMKGSEGSGKAGKVPVGAEVFVGTYYRRANQKGADTPFYDLTSPGEGRDRQYDLRQVNEGTVTEITLEGDAVGDYQLLNVVREDEVLGPAVALGDREIIFRDVPGTKLLDGSIGLDTGTRLASISPCVCDTAEYSDPFELTEDLTIETRPSLITKALGASIQRQASFVLVLLGRARVGLAWVSTLDVQKMILF